MIILELGERNLGIPLHILCSDVIVLGLGEIFNRVLLLKGIMSEFGLSEFLKEGFRDSDGESAVFLLELGFTRIVGMFCVSVSLI